MNKSVLLTALSLGLLAAPFAHASKRTELAYVESYRGRSDLPVPLSVVSPEVDPEHAGIAVELVFIVDEAGRPVDISTRTPVDRALQASLTRAVAQWRFAPARDAEGRPVSTKVVLPLRIVDGESSETEIAQR